MKTNLQKYIQQEFQGSHFSPTIYHGVPVCERFSFQSGAGLGQQIFGAFQLGQFRLGQIKTFQSLQVLAVIQYEQNTVTTLMITSKAFKCSFNANNREYVVCYKLSTDITLLGVYCAVCFSAAIEQQMAPPKKTLQNFNYFSILSTFSCLNSCKYPART